MNILVLNGPNLNMLGRREPEIYGNDTLENIERDMASEAAKLGATIKCMQSNSEGELVSAIQDAAGWADAIIINAAAYTHTSVAIHDALKAVAIPAIEVHLSNIYAREPFRHHSYISPVAAGVICGFGREGYLMALRAAAAIHKK
jgi:3-dehydroquinate dehydratase-2